MTITYLNLKMLTFLKYTTDIPQLCKLANCSPGAWDPTETEKLAPPHMHTHTDTHIHSAIQAAYFLCAMFPALIQGLSPTCDVFNLIVTYCHPSHFRLQPAAGTASAKSWPLRHIPLLIVSIWWKLSPLLTPELSPSQSLPLLHPSKSCQSQTHAASKLPFKPASPFLFTPQPTPSYTTLVLPSCSDYCKSLPLVGLLIQVLHPPAFLFLKIINSDHTTYLMKNYNWRPNT